MSASNQKKLRKLKAEAYMSERQRMEAKEKKKLKIYTATFWIIMAICVCVVVGAIAINPIKNVVYANTDAIKIADHTLSAVELNYFYIDAVNNYVQQYSSYISYILDVNSPLNEQIADKTTGASWADTFLDMALENIKSTYSLYDLAQAAGHKLSEDEKKSVDTMFSNLDVYAAYYGYEDADAYLRGVYGPGANSESYRKYYEASALADSYYTVYADSLEYSAEQLRAYEKDKLYEYSSYTFTTYYLNAVNFREGGTKDDDGNITYTDDEKQAAIEKAQQAANELAAGTYNSRDEFDKAVAALKINEGKTDVKSTVYEDVLYSSVNTLFRDFVIGKVEKADDNKDEDEDVFEERKEGDLKVVVNESGSGDSKVINGYYVVRFEKVEKNEFNLRNVRHILVQFTGGSYNSTTGETTYTDAEKKEAKLAAEKLLKEWEDGAKTEDSFADLATQKSEDSGSKANGGLYEEVYPGQMVEQFEDWLFDSERKVGDTGLVETKYGYHIMYYVGEAEITYRDYMITNTMRNEDLEKWHTDMVDKAVLTELNMKYVEMDLILNG